jgi:hypothetical protein
MPAQTDPESTSLHRIYFDKEFTAKELEIGSHSNFARRREDPAPFRASLSLRQRPFRRRSQICSEASNCDHRGLADGRMIFSDRDFPVGVRAQLYAIVEDAHRP